MHITSMLNLRGGPCLLEIVDITADSGLYCNSPCELDENLVYAANRELIRVMLIAYSGFKLAVSSVLQTLFIFWSLYHCLRVCLRADIEIAVRHVASLHFLSRTCLFIKCCCYIC